MLAATDSAGTILPCSTSTDWTAAQKFLEFRRSWAIEPLNRSDLSTDHRVVLHLLRMYWRGPTKDFDAKLAYAGLRRLQRETAYLRGRTEKLDLFRRIQPSGHWPPPLSYRLAIHKRRKVNPEVRPYHISTHATTRLP